jgi:hypothetical protein
VKKKKHNGERERLGVVRYVDEHLPDTYVRCMERKFAVVPLSGSVGPYCLTKLLNNKWVLWREARWGEMREYFPNYKSALRYLKTHLLLTGHVT